MKADASSCGNSAPPPNSSVATSGMHRIRKPSDSSRALISGESGRLAAARPAGQNRGKEPDAPACQSRLAAARPARLVLFERRLLPGDDVLERRELLRLQDRVVLKTTPRADDDDGREKAAGGDERGL